MANEHDANVPTSKFSFRNLVWPDLSQLEVNDQDRALLPPASLGAFITSLCAIAFFAVLAFVLFAATDGPLRYALFFAMVPGAVLSICAFISMIRVTLIVRGREPKGTP